MKIVVETKGILKAEVESLVIEMYTTCNTFVFESDGADVIKQ